MSAVLRLIAQATSDEVGFVTAEPDSYECGIVENLLQPPENVLESP